MSEGQEKTELEHKLAMLGSATWTHQQLDQIGKDALAMIAELRESNGRLATDYRTRGEKFRAIQDGADQ